MIFTTSWDDGYKMDLKLAALLEQYGCKGTFYVCPRKQHGHEMLSEEEVSKLRERHEIGAHTLRHPKLTEVSSVEAMSEIKESKDWVEQVTGTKCDMFCYPFGMWNEKVRELAMQAGFKGARTTERMQFAVTDPFTMPTTLQVTPFPKRKVWSRWWHPFDRYGPLRVRRPMLKKLGIKKSCLKTWLELAICLFDYGIEHSEPVFHLWGHSHEIEKYKLWNELEQFLKHVQKSGVECRVNSKVLS